MLRRAAELARRESRPAQVQKAMEELRLVDERKALAERLPALLSGADRPKDATDAYNVEYLFYDRRLFASGARFFEAVFRADPKLADDLEQREPLQRGVPRGPGRQRFRDRLAAAR